MTLKRPVAKVNHIYAHLITLSDEKSGTILLKGLKNEFVESKGQSGPLKSSQNIYDDRHFKLGAKQ